MFLYMHYLGCVIRFDLCEAECADYVASSVTWTFWPQVSITMIATGFGSGVVEAALRPAARRQPQQQQQQQQQYPPPRQVPVERWVVS